MLCLLGAPRHPPSVGCRPSTATTVLLAPRLLMERAIQEKSNPNAYRRIDLVTNYNGPQVTPNDFIPQKAE